MHMIQEVLSPGRYKYKVYNARGALLFVGESASIAQSIYQQGKAKELEAEKNARLSRNDRSNRSSDISEG